MKQGTQYRQLSYEERVQIEVLSTAGTSIRSIAHILRRSPNTIARELREKRVCGCYIPKKAQHKTYWRRYTAKRHCMKVARSTSLEQFIREKLIQNWSPERMAGYLQRTGVRVSKKAIYKFIHSRCLEQKLFWKKHHKRGGPKRRDISHKDTSKRSLSQRPSLEGSGHIELDFIVSKQSPTVLLVTVDRYSRKTHIRKLLHKTPHAVHEVLQELQRTSPLKTITTDNDIVFKKWREMEDILSIPFFFTQPYHSWEKGLVENTNRWIRASIPKKRDLATVSDDELRGIEYFLNETPRQCLGYQTASEVLLSVTKVS